MPLNAVCIGSPLSNCPLPRGRESGVYRTEMNSLAYVIHLPCIQIQERFRSSFEMMILLFNAFASLREIFESVLLIQIHFIDTGNVHDLRKRLPERFGGVDA